MRSHFGENFLVVAWASARRVGRPVGGYANQNLRTEAPMTSLGQTKNESPDPQARTFSSGWKSRLSFRICPRWKLSVLCAIT
ncbi:hypothetical protein JAAARDRAFT_39532 [Jaapia argillacea MUCL 33604]|uniref:Uncharacterized protein n=1 Tax=Jaapia argillacea MUCL 33604 TaxID=933084 RepID=A0A067PPD8_9AGAM|nr:hypothetical protein JAAARDRAFT_39532 [Jaapia argillacea MUCL 33604]